MDDARVEAGQLRVAAAEQRVGEEPVVQRVVRPRRRPGLGVAVAEHPHRRVVVGDRHRAGGAGPQRGDREPVPEQLVVGDREGVEEQHPAGGVHSHAVAEAHVDERLVEGDPEPDPVAEAGGGQVGVLGEPGGGVAVQPAAGVFEGLRQVPVVEGGHRVDAGGQQLVDQPVVEVQAGRVGRAGAGGLHPGPGDREPVRGDAQPGQQRDVLGVPVVVVAGHLAGAAVADPRRGSARRCPRWTDRGRRPRWRPRSGGPMWRHPSGSRWGTGASVRSTCALPVNVKRARDFRALSMNAP